MISGRGCLIAAVLAPFAAVAGFVCGVILGFLVSSNIRIEDLI